MAEIQPPACRAHRFFFLVFFSHLEVPETLFLGLRDSQCRSGGCSRLGENISRSILFCNYSSFDGERAVSPYYPFLFQYPYPTESLPMIPEIISQEGWEKLLQWEELGKICTHQGVGWIQGNRHVIFS